LLFNTLLWLAVVAVVHTTVAAVALVVISLEHLLMHQAPH
jgi:hypothetical protein